MATLYRRTWKDKTTGRLIEGEIWWVKYYDDGKPIRESTGKANRHEAEKVRQRLEGKAEAGQREGPSLKRTRIDDLFVDLENDYRMKRRKTFTRRKEQYAHLKPVFGGMHVRLLTTPTLHAYVAQRLGEGAAPATVNRELDCLHRMLILGQRQTPPKVGALPHFPRLTEDNVREGFCEHDTYLRIRAAAPYHIQVALTIGYYTGLRKGEILSLRWDEHMDLVNHCIRLKSTETKNKTPRVIYMEGDLLMVMEKAKAVRDRQTPHCSWVVQFKGHRIKENFDHGWTALLKRLGVKLLFHDLRRSGVRNLVRAGVPETVAMKISGHRTRSVFDRYNITSEEDLKAAATRLNVYTEQQAAALVGTAMGTVLGTVDTFPPSGGAPDPSQPLE